MDNHEAIKIGDLEKAQESLPVVEPKFISDLPEDVVREGADELTLRREGMLRTLVDTTNVGDSSGGPPLVNEDWHAISQAIYKGVEGPEWEVTFFEYVEMRKGTMTQVASFRSRAEGLKFERVFPLNGWLWRFFLVGLMSD